MVKLYADEQYNLSQLETIEGKLIRIKLPSL